MSKNDDQKNVKKKIKNHHKMMKYDCGTLQPRRELSG